MKIKGSKDADTLYGTDQGDVISGLAGDDRLYGNGSDDLILTGAGEDFARGGSGDDRIGGFELTATALYQSGAIVTEGDGEYRISGGDLLDGGTGDDVIVSGLGTIVDGGAGVDFVDVDVVATLVRSGDQSRAVLNYDVNQVDLGEAANGSVTLRIGSEFGGLDVVLRGVERFEITFGSGDDIVFGGSYDDRLYGDSDIYGILPSPGGDDQLSGGGGDDYLYGGLGADRLFGGEGDDRLYGGNEYFTLNDRIVDQLDGGDGDDHLTILTSDLADGGQGYDTAELLLDAHSYRYVLDVGLMHSDVIAYEFAGGTRVIGIEHYERIKLGFASDRVVGSTDVETVNGGDGADALYGRGADDVLSGDGGDDVLRGGAGADQLLGYNGDDWLNGGRGADRMDGEFGDDTYVVDDAGDAILEYPGFGTDRVIASIDYVLPAAMENLTFGGGDDLAGTGNASDNSITGNTGANALSGLAGNDTITGNGGADRLTGGGGADLFVFGPELLSGDQGDAPRITDFSASGRDRIDLSTIDAVTATAGDDAFHFLGTAAFSGTAGQLRLEIGAETRLVGDVDGDGQADFAIVLTGSPSITDAALIL